MTDNLVWFCVAEHEDGTRMKRHSPISAGVFGRTISGSMS
jgi:hypothetical protein